MVKVDNTVSHETQNVFGITGKWLVGSLVGHFEDSERIGYRTSKGIIAVNKKDIRVGE